MGRKQEPNHQRFGKRKKCTVVCFHLQCKTVKLFLFRNVSSEMPLRLQQQERAGWSGGVWSLFPLNKRFLFVWGTDFSNIVVSSSVHISRVLLSCLFLHSGGRRKFLVKVFVQAVSGGHQFMKLICIYLLVQWAAFALPLSVKNAFAAFFSFLIQISKQPNGDPACLRTPCSSTH